MPNSSDKPAWTHGQEIEDLMVKAQEQGDKKPSPELQAKQRRLLQMLSADTSSQPPTDSNESATAEPKRKLPEQPQRADFKTQEAYEEAMGYWQSHVGRIKAMAERARRSKGSPASSK